MDDRFGEEPRRILPRTLEFGMSVLEVHGHVFRRNTNLACEIDASATSTSKFMRSRRPCLSSAYSCKCGPLLVSGMRPSSISAEMCVTAAVACSVDGRADGNFAMLLLQDQTPVLVFVAKKSQQVSTIVYSS